MQFYFERKIDALGRVVIPRDVRRMLSLQTNDDLILKVEDGKIVIHKKEQP